MFNFFFFQRAGRASFHLKDLLDVFIFIFSLAIICSTQHLEAGVLLLSDLLEYLGGSIELLIYSEGKNSKLNSLQARSSARGDLAPWTDIKCKYK